MFSIKNAICCRWRFLFYLCLLPALSGAVPDLSMMRMHVVPDFSKQTIRVACTQTWNTEAADTVIVLKLYPQLLIDSVLLNGTACQWQRDSMRIVVRLYSNHPQYNKLHIVYHGSPLPAPEPPWDGGFVWTTDPQGNQWLTVAVQDKGASVWWPAPDVFSDHPDSAVVSCTYPAKLFFKGNGKMINDRMIGEKLRYTAWKSSYPINTYNITLNIGNYAILRDTLIRRDGSLLELSYFPLKKNTAAAAKQFQQVKPMLDCYERYFGNYPYMQDGFSIVEVPYAGMEHQGAIAYGNGYENGYLGKDYSGIGLDFDFILIHESGHQWWGNSVTAATASDVWFQEAFCTYAEYIYVNCRYGEKTARDYINAKKRLVKNEAPILGKDDSGIDKYAKGALMLYTLEKLIGSGLWRDLVHEFAATFQYTPIETKHLIKWFSEKTGRNLEGFFRQYLERADIPVFEYQILPRIADDKPINIRYRVANAFPGFQLPVELYNGRIPAGTLVATGNWQETEIMSTAVRPDESASYFSAVNLNK